jgi:iron complex outermembrane receptor protein/outer membrane receptor for ferric coprogen and ferric-rhodotorulic acid
MKPGDIHVMQLNAIGSALQQGRKVLAVALMGGAVLPPAIAAIPTMAQAQTTRNFAIPAGPLATVLNRFADQSGTEIVYNGNMTDGLSSSGLSGRFSTAEALSRILAGTGLTFRPNGANSFTLDHAPRVAEGTVELGSVLVESTALSDSAAASLSAAAVTEGTHSYATRATTLGHMPETLREIPQSITVMTRQRIEDQNLLALDQVLEQTPGMTKQIRGFGDNSFESRGINLGLANYMIDGVPGTIVSPVGWAAADTAIYDRVEVLRGAAGLLVGAGDPSGVVNLVHKRPLDTFHVNFAAFAGSWNNYRGEVDVTGPLTSSGNIRGRVVAAYQNQGFFFDAQHAMKPLIYGVVSADLAPDTTLTLGVRHEEKTTHGYWIFGMPRYTDGRHIDLPRSTSLAPDWNRMKTTVTEVFADIEHRFASDWSATLSANYLNTDVAYKAALPNGPVDPVTLTGARYTFVDFTHRALPAKGIDLHASGSFSALGRDHHMLLGANWSIRNQTASSASADLSVTAIDLFHYDRSLYVEPAQPAWDSVTRDQDVRYGLYGKLKLSLADPLTVIVGGRISWLRYSNIETLTGTTLSNYRQNAQITPYAGLVYDVAHHWSLYASYADIFSPQTEYFAANGRALSPAIGANIEAGVKGSLLGDQLNVSAAVFRVKRRNVAVADYSSDCSAYGYSGSGGYCYDTQDITHSGFEIEAQGRITPDWDIMTGYTYMDLPKDVQVSTQEHQFKIFTNWRLPARLGRFRIGGGVNYMSTFKRGDGSLNLPARALVSLRGSYRISDHLEAAVNIENLFDKTYYTDPGELRRVNIYGEPRSFMVSLRGRY